MSELEQWVNLTQDTEWQGDGLNEKARMGPVAVVRVEMAKKQSTAATYTLDRDENNAKYSSDERLKDQHFRIRGYSRLFLTEADGTAELHIDVSLAGGDKFTVTVEDDKGNKQQTDTIVTRRKLYFQVVRMEEVNKLSAGDIKTMQDTYWDEKENQYIRMVEHTKDETIPERPNINSADGAAWTELMKDLRGVYSTSKNPYSFVVLLAKRTNSSGLEVRDSRQVFKAGGLFRKKDTHSFKTRKILFDSVDPNVDYFHFLHWIPDSGGRQYAIPRSRLTRRGEHEIIIDTKGYPKGSGRLLYSMEVLESPFLGLASRNDNLTIVATEHPITGQPRGRQAILATLVHEMGHKMGMVPGPESPQPLDKQDHYYDHRGHLGPHCHYPLEDNDVETDFAKVSYPKRSLLKPLGVKPTCTMFGSSASNTHEFCDECKTSIRKLDLRSQGNPGIRTQF